MKNQLGVLMDPIESIHYKKDSTFAMLLEATRRNYVIHYFQQKDIFVSNGEVWAHAHILRVFDQDRWFELGESQQISLGELNVILMRKDPPFDLNYIYTTYLLELVEQSGVKVVNKPQSLRDCNEKMFSLWFPECIPPTLVTSSIKELERFYEEHQDIVCKPLDGMGGASIFRVKPLDENASVIFENLTGYGKHFMMAQKYIPEIKKGDKRILLINGEPVPFSLARIPKPGELRGNLVAGAQGVAHELTERDYFICHQLAPQLRERGLMFVGLDVIGDFLTEINITSPTCIRELDQLCKMNIAGLLFDQLSE